jgi:hypothetical protein
VTANERNADVVSMWVAFGLAFLSIVVATLSMYFVANNFEERRCVALEQRLNEEGHVVNLVYGSRGCVLAEDE